MSVIQLVIWLGACSALFVAAFEWPFGSVPQYRSERWHSLIAAASGLFCACSAVNMNDLPHAWLLVHRIQIAAGALVIYAWLRYARVVQAGPRTALEGPLEWAVLAVVPLSLLGLLQAGGIFQARFLGTSAPIIVCNPVGQLSYLLLLFGMAVSLRRFIQAAREEVPHALPHALALAAVLATGLNDVAATLGVPTVPILLTIGLFTEVIVLGVVAARRWAGDARRASELSASLELQVEARTQELRLAQRALEQSERLAVLGRIAAGVAHEINNPAAAISSNLQLLREAQEHGGLDAPDAVEALDDAISSVGRISRIVRELLATGRAAGNPVSGACDVGASLLSAARRAELTPGVASRALIDPVRCEGLLAQAEAEALEQVLINLAINGAHAIPAGRLGRVGLRAERKGDRVLVHVTDDGEGMSEEVRAHLFEPFFSTKPFGAGTGLGLSVSLGLVRGMGGDLSVDSVVGRGTTMTVSLRAAS